MWLNKLNDMSVGPLWVLRDRQSAANPDTGHCTVCGQAWLETDLHNATTLIVVPEALTDGAQQALLANCLAAAGLSETAASFSLHTACASDSHAAITALEQYLSASPVKRVIVFGETAARRINPEFTRGTVHDWQQIRLVVTHHPDRMLANPALKAETWSDLCLALHDA